MKDPILTPVGFDEDELHIFAAVISSPATYDDKRKSITHTPCALIILRMDYCQNTFSVAPCTATGTKCYNTFPTCRDKANYSKTTKDYKFTSVDVPLPFHGARPYIKDVKNLSTEIKSDKFVHQRMKATMFDEPDTDVGIDPYLDSRSSVQGDFWKKFIQRNKNYRNREFIHKRGFFGTDESEFQDDFTGELDNIKTNKNETVMIEAVDLLKKLSSIKIPEEIDVKLPADINSSQTDITVSDASKLDDPVGGTKYIKINSEIISYTIRNLTTNQISGGAREQFNTTAASHNKNDKVEKVRYYSPQNGFDILNVEMLQTDAAISTSYINTTAFTNLKTDPVEDINYWGLITKPTDLDKLYFGLVNHLGAVSWVDESGKITIDRLVPNKPDRTYVTISDEMSIVFKSGSVDMNDDDRKTRVPVYWHKSALGDVDDEDSYKRRDVVIDSDAESPNDMDAQEPDAVYSRWLHEDLATEEEINQYVKNNFARRLFRLSDPQPLFSFEVELKDMDIAVGEVIKVTTDLMQDIYGNPITDRKAFITKRTPKGSKVEYTAQLMPEEKICYVAPDSTPDYDNASDAEKEYGFITDNDGLIDSKPGYYHY